MKKLKWNYLTAVAFLALLMLISILVVIIKSYYDLSALRKQYALDQAQTTYRYHLAFISESSSDDFWDSVYESARDAGREADIYVERFGQNLSISYTLEEQLQMAIAANVDAILIAPSGTETITELINTAQEKGIPTGTLYRDQIDSNRYNFTGVNSVSLGYEYGKLALSCASDTDSKVMVLFDENETTTERRLLTSGISRALSESRSPLQLDNKEITESNSFDAEEDIRRFVKDYHNRIDIIICTTVLQTQYVSQAAIDMNYVGDFKIIGFYQNPTVLEALKNNVISANLVIDARQMGTKAIKNLAEYLEYGYSSDYSQVDAYVIGSEDATRLLKEESEEQALQEGGIPE